MYEAIVLPRPTFGYIGCIISASFHLIFTFFSRLYAVVKQTRAFAFFSTQLAVPVKKLVLSVFSEGHNGVIPSNWASNPKFGALTRNSNQQRYVGTMLIKYALLHVLIFLHKLWK